MDFQSSTVPGLARGAGLRLPPASVMLARDVGGKLMGKAQELKMFRTETDFVRWLSRVSRERAPHVTLGIGDDAALARISHGHELVLATDLSIEGIHFTPSIHSPRSVGHRALARALSDMAAMGATPRFALVSLAMPKRTTRQWLQQFYAGMRSLARHQEVSIIGGDTAVVAGRLTADVVAAGEVPRGEAVKRAGARPGDLIFVSGRLGMSELGLRLLRDRIPRASNGRRLADSRVWKEAIHAHLFPEPRCRLGRYLAERHLPSAMMDISDGLSSDLARLTQASGTGARIFEDMIPVQEALSREQSFNLALNGGEDYELLFTVPPSKASRVPSRFCGLPVRQIGSIYRGRSLKLVGPDGKERVLRPGGYDHFRAHSVVR